MQIDFQQLNQIVDLETTLHDILIPLCKDKQIDAHLAANIITEFTEKLRDKEATKRKYKVWQKVGMNRDNVLHEGWLQVSDFKKPKLVPEDEAETISWDNVIKHIQYNSTAIETRIVEV